MHSHTGKNLKWTQIKTQSQPAPISSLEWHTTTPSPTNRPNVTGQWLVTALQPVSHGSYSMMAPESYYNLCVCDYVHIVTHKNTHANNHMHTEPILTGRRWGVKTGKDKDRDRKRDRCRDKDRSTDRLIWREKDKQTQTDSEKNRYRPTKTQRKLRLTETNREYSWIETKGRRSDI